MESNALKVLYRLHNAKFKGYLVGGAVRDLMLERRLKDFDVSTDARPTEAIVDNLLSWRHRGFSAHGAVRVDDRGTRPQ